MLTFVIGIAVAYTWCYSAHCGPAALVKDRPSHTECHNLHHHIFSAAACHNCLTSLSIWGVSHLVWVRFSSPHIALYNVTRPKASSANHNTRAILHGSDPHLLTFPVIMDDLRWLQAAGKRKPRNGNRVSRQSQTWIDRGNPRPRVRSRTR